RSSPSRVTPWMQLATARPVSKRSCASPPRTWGSWTSDYRSSTAEVARRVRAARGRDPFLIALSGFGRPQDRKDALDAGFDVHLVKPVDVSEISRLLGSVRRRANGNHAA